jgi:hypothetical protein
MDSLAAPKHVGDRTSDFPFRVRNRTLKRNDIKARTMPLCRGAFDAEYK